MSRESTKAALDRFFTRHAKHEARPTRKNQKPELTLTVHPCLEWCEANGWSVHTVEAKAVYNPQAGRYLEGQTVSGMSDLVGCTSAGMGAFIECKAPGKLSTLSQVQREFLTDKIKLGAFAVVVDSVQRLERLYLGWNTTRGLPNANNYLLEQLPPEPKRREGKVNPEFGF